MFIWSNLGQIPQRWASGHARIKNLIWDQLLATKAEIIQSLSVFSFCVQNRKFLFLFFQREYSMGSKRYYVLRQPWMNALTVINKIMFTLPEAIVEFSGEKLNLGACQTL